MGCLGSGWTSKTYTLQIQGPEFDTQKPRENARHGAHSVHLGREDRRVPGAHWLAS